MWICEKEKCTGCNACINLCPKGCIHMKNNKIEMKSAFIEEDKCVHCGLCRSVCPQLNELTAESPKECYAAWSNDDSTRKFAASGGIATELCRYLIDKDGLYAGVLLTDTFEAEFILTDNADLLSKVRNSKYVYSDTKQIYTDIAKELANGKSIVFVGLPCQVDGLTRYLSLKKADTTNLLTVDLICHGVMPYEFLQQHVRKIEKSHKKKAKTLYFRDPYTYTYTFSLSMYDNKKAFYRRKVNRNDTYQIAYHYGIAYRENCYSCKYAREERVGDLTLADFSYVGKKAPCQYDNKNVSCILVNNQKGKEYLTSLKREDWIFMEQRPLEEELLYEKQLQHPTAKRPERKIFIENYEQTRDFEKAMKIAAKSIIRENEMEHYLHLEKIKGRIKRMIPKNLLK